MQLFSTPVPSGNDSHVRWGLPCRPFRLISSSSVQTERTCFVWVLFFFFFCCSIFVPVVHDDPWPDGLENILTSLKRNKFQLFQFCSIKAPSKKETKNGRAKLSFALIHRGVIFKLNRIKPHLCAENSFIVIWVYERARVIFIAAVTKNLASIYLGGISRGLDGWWNDGNRWWVGGWIWRWSEARMFGGQGIKGSLLCGHKVLAGGAGTLWTLLFLISSIVTFTKFTITQIYRKDFNTKLYRILL